MTPKQVLKKIATKLEELPDLKGGKEFFGIPVDVELTKTKLLGLVGILIKAKGAILCSLDIWVTIDDDLCGSANSELSIQIKGKDDLEKLILYFREGYTCKGLNEEKEK